MARAWVEDRADHAAYREAVAKAKAAGRRPPFRWRVRWRDLDGKQRSKAVERKPDADALRKRIENELEGGTYRDASAGRARLGEVAETWMAAQVKQKRSTLRLYRITLDKHILPRWGTVPVERIHRDDIVSWLNSLTAGDSQKRQIRGVLLRVLDWCIPEHLTVNPVRRVPAQKTSEPGEVEPLSAAQVEALAAAADRTVTRVFILVLAYVGLRWGEAAAVKARDVDLKARRIQIRRTLIEGEGGLYEDTPKTGKSRTVPLPASVAAELEPLIAQCPEPDSYVFRTPAGTPLRAGNWRRREFDPAVKAAGLGGQKITPHTLRHTAASLAIAGGADVKVVQTMLGHASAKMTLDLYGHLFPDRLDEVAGRMDAARLKVIEGEGLRNDER